jgi:hypothetical protein
MKKQLIAAFVLVAAAIGATTPSWAFQSVQKSSVTAGTFVGGTRTARFTLNVRNISNQNVNLVAGSSITWSGVNAGDGWKMADRLLVINSTVTDSNGGIQIYTENTAADAVPAFVDPTPANKINADSAAGGLVQGNSGSSSVVLPMAWSIKDGSRIVEGGTAATGVGAADPNNGPTTAVNNNKFQWLFVTDRYNTQGVDFNGDGDVTDPTDSAPFVDGSAYASMVLVNGIHVQQAPTDIEARADGTDSFVYLEANFAAASAQTAYQTTALRVEAYIQ